MTEGSEVVARFEPALPVGGTGPDPRAAVRGLLGDLSGIDPARFRFRLQPGGRPVLRREKGIPDLRFSLSHAGGLLLCAASRDRDVGADVECLDRLGPHPLESASELCTPGEFDDLLRTPPELVRERFLLLWAMKEAVAKARGLGLRLPLFRIRVFPGEPGRPAMALEPGSPGGVPCWRLAPMWLTPRHVACVAVRAGPGEEVRVRFERAVPVPALPQP